MSIDTAPAATSPAAPSPARALWANKRISIPLAILGGVFIMSVLRVVTGANDMNSSGAIGAALGLAVPIAMAGLGGLWSERAGIVNIGLEGMMIMGTWSAAYFALNWGAWAGVLGAIIGGAIGGALHALATVVFTVDQIVSGVAINIIGLGVTKYLADRVFGRMEGGGPTQSPGLPDLPTVTLPGSSFLASVEKHQWFFISDLAGMLGGLITNLSVLTIIAIVLVFASVFLLWRTRFGLRLRSCGENPWAAETLGVKVNLYKFIAVLISGGLAGLGGGFLAMVASSNYIEGQTGGRGYIGLAAMIFGNWNPIGMAAGALLFGYTDAIQLRGGGTTVHALLLLLAVIVLLVGLWQIVRRHRYWQGVIALLIGAALLVIYFKTDTIPTQLTSTTPYVTTLLVMALASQRLRMPKADGQIYHKGEAG
ncbi:ABC transporter permease [Branchiibius sp. NY16-3462-2]|uniref:ABC transporter permease n=1 Tax=Branchiibius sp. NY16-3462-2 TaxID=1807500 RepID=UPI00079A3FEE|nr:ABC transporter permease [Branchiibius sp. NY16-3462-2]KYH43037.1 ABC transporter permease [Branchiibius sp. NY16-3462-2]